ncbi:MAG: hypothetical protein WCH65_05545 [bacterium]
MCGVVSSFNIINGDVTMRTKEGITVRIPYTTIKKVVLPTKKDSSSEAVAQGTSSPITKK